MHPTTQIEKIYRVWSDAKEEQIAVRIRFSVEESAGTAKVFHILGREEWQ